MISCFLSSAPLYDERNLTRISSQINRFFAIFSDYLLSNNHVNAIIVHKFDFSDEEVMAYYISFLKTLSFRLNKHTIHFFYNEVSREDENPSYIGLSFTGPAAKGRLLSLLITSLIKRSSFEGDLSLSYCHTTW